MLKVEYFYYMIEIAKTGAINKAADNLYISQPYLSLTLKEIEKELNILLFKRSSKGVSLTEAGEVFLRYCYNFIEIIDKSKNIQHEYYANNHVLSVSSMYSFTILDIFHNFCYTKNNVDNSMNYEEIPNDFILERVSKKICDIGFVFTSSQNLTSYLAVIEKLGLRWQPLLEEPLFAVFHCNHPLAQKDIIQAEELENYNYVVEKIKQPNKSPSVENNLLPNKFKSNKLMSVKFDNNRSLLYYITKNPDVFTIGQKSLNITNPFLTSGSLRYIPIENLPLTMITGYVVNKGVNHSPLLLDFEEYVQDYFKMYQSFQN